MKHYQNCTILTMDNKGTIYKDASIIEQDGQIIDIGKTKDLLNKYPQATKINLEGKLVIPGLINNHFHLAQSMFRGFSDDMLIEPWLFKKIWPLQSAHDTETFLAGSRLAMLEMSKTGTTTFVESMIIHYGLEPLLEEVEKSGMRARLAKVVMNPKEGILLPKALTQTLEESLKEARQTRQKINNKDMIDIWLGPRWTGLYDPHLIEQINEIMDKEDFSTTIHFAESPEDVDKMLKDNYKSAGDFLQRTGMLDRKYLLIHCTNLTEKDLDLLAKGKATIAHCPVSAMKTCMGYANVPKMLEKGVAVGIGTDAPSCNNSSDLLAEIKTAALLHKHQSGQPDLLPAELALAMGTRIGAKSIFAEDKLGSLEVGKKADFITLNLDYAAPLPDYNLPAAIVYALCGRDVIDVFVDGKQLVKNGESLIFDEPKVRADARQAMKTLLKRANL